MSMCLLEWQVITFIGLQPPYSRYMNHPEGTKTHGLRDGVLSKNNQKIAKASKVSKPNTWILRNHRHETVFFNTTWTTGPLDTQVGLSLQQLGVVINFNFNCILNVFFFAQRVTP